MPKSIARLAAGTLAAGALLVAASPAQATVTMSTPTPYTFFGAKVSFWVTGDTTEPIYIRQIRPSNLVGPGRCWPRGDTWQDVNFVGNPLAVITPTKPYETTKVTISASRLKFSGGDPKAPTYGGQDGTGGSCQDFVTKYNRIGAFQEGGQFRVGDERRLIRLF